MRYGLCAKQCAGNHNYRELLWNEGNVERIDEFFSPQFANFGIPYSDVRGMIQHIINVWRSAFPDLRFRIDELVAEQDTVMCEVTMSGTHLGDFQLIVPLKGPTLPPNGRKFEVKHIHRFRLKDAKIVEHFAVRDDLGMFQQLEHLLPSAALSLLNKRILQTKAALSLAKLHFGRLTGKPEVTHQKAPHNFRFADHPETGAQSIRHGLNNRHCLPTASDVYEKGTWTIVL